MILSVADSIATVRCDGCARVFARGRGAAMAQKRHFHDRPCYRSAVTRASRLTPERRAYLRDYMRTRRSKR